MQDLDFQTHLIPCLSDNYAVLLHEAQSGQTVLVDAPEEEPILKALAEKGWTLTHILITHHHWDHTQALESIKAQTGAKVYGPKVSLDKVPQIDEGLEDGSEVPFGESGFLAMGTPGHTLDHISYWIPDAEMAFTGDAFFSLGCGRVFEGNLKDMWFAIDRIAKLPPETIIYCGHEYTEANGNFCLSIEPDNEHLKRRMEEVKSLRADGKPTLPTTMLEERATNSFIRANDPDVKKALGMEGKEDWEVFAEIRTRKDNF
ncbi:MAG: hydroxyacylglutathione hydrolase [Cohaesibacter sp.]|nr:hydroxyacylglutathione hydrolase [Cohaesibacter sp.]